MMPRFEDAACGDGTEPTVQLCLTCWARPECLAWALEWEDTGFWAGRTPGERAQLRRKFGIELRTVAIGGGR